MNTLIPKVTIYRIGKLEEGNPTVDLLLMVRNPNNSKARVGFKDMTPAQLVGLDKKVNTKVIFPAQEINVDTQEIYHDQSSVAPSQAADSAATTIKA